MAKDKAESPLAEFVDRLAGLVDQVFELEYGPPPSLAADEYEVLSTTAGKLIRAAPTAAGDVGELAVDAIEKLGAFQFRVERELTDEKNRWQDHPSDDRYWDEEALGAKAIFDSHGWDLARLFYRALGYLKTFGPPNSEAPRLGKRMKPDAETLNVIKHIQGGKNNNAIDDLTKKGVGAIRQIRSRLKHGRYEL